eukprot:GHUV01002198.1.p1 GENE.GHUV01002198.1~~GHUV01002198.1.p1  ORF type:complete len:211 (+),score=67.08 GHUV01002198.1:187-819(+)
MQSQLNTNRPVMASRRQVQPMAFLGNLFKSTTKQSKVPVRQQRKEELLDLIDPLKRGLAATEEDKEAVEAVVQQLEKMNPTPRPLESPFVNGRWRLVYTTSESILGTNKLPFLRPSGPIYQLIDAENLKAANRETSPLYNQVTAELTPLSTNKVAVQFKTFKIGGLIPITAPPSAKGELAITYLDEDMRISRGDKGNLFVLLMDDPDDRP